MKSKNDNEYERQQALTATDSVVLSIDAVVCRRGWELGAWRDVMKGGGWRRAVVQLSVMVKNNARPSPERKLESTLKRVTVDCSRVQTSRKKIKMLKRSMAQ